MAVTQNLVKLAIEHGFSFSAPLDPSKLEFKEEVRQMCAANRCHSYGKNWMCPPACGELAYFSEKVLQFKHAIIVQTKGELEDSFDIESIEETGKKNNELFSSFAEKLRSLLPEMMPLGAGACTNCPKCTYPDEPCRFPDKAYPSLEACGLIVTEVCNHAGIGYYYGPNTITFTGAFLFN